MRRNASQLQAQRSNLLAVTEQQALDTPDGNAGLLPGNIRDHFNRCRYTLLPVFRKFGQNSNDDRDLLIPDHVFGVFRIGLNDCALLLVYHLQRDLDLAEHWLYTAMEQARALVEAAVDDATYAEHFETYGDTYANLAVLYGLRGRQDKVDEMYKQLRAIDPTRSELPPEGGAP